MTFKRIICLMLVCVLSVLLLAGCGESSTQSYNENAKILSVGSGVVASNGKLELMWDDNLKCVLLKNKETGKVWSNIPYDAYLRGEEYSTLDVAVQNMQDYQTDKVSSADFKISCEKIDNGIRLTYYCDSKRFSIPVEFVLRDDSVRLSIDASKIVEDEQNAKIYYAAPSSKFCSVLQTAEDAYIFAPYGTGALINTGFLPDGKRRIESSGRNVASLSTRNTVDSGENSNFQVFGIKDGSDSLLCIAEDCPGAVGIHFLAGDRQSDYTSIYPVFYFVDTDSVKGRAANSGDVTQLSSRSQSLMSVGFYPLSGENSDYNGMALRYRKYLSDSGFIKENSSSKNFDSPYAVTVLGGVKTTSSILGIPVSTLKPMTTFSTAQKMISELVDNIGIKPVVRLVGFGKDGVNIGEVAGGYAFSSKLGSNKDRASLEEYCSNNDIPLYTQFELLKYSKTGSGFSYTFNSAKTATLHSAEQKGVNIPLRDFNEDLSYRLLSRSKITSAVNKLISFADKKNVSGVCLSSLGEISYSDYGDGEKYSTTALMDTDTKEYVERIIESGHSVSGSAATYFAAGLMDAVFESPLDTSGLYQVEKDIPFYQIVFAGTTPLYSAPINFDSNPERKIMLAAASGTGLGFSLIDEFDKTYMEDNVYRLYGCVYDKNKDYIKSVVSEYSKVFSQVAGSAIKRYDIIDDNITKTTFENGKVIYANHSSKEADSPVGVLGGYGFKIGSEE